MSFYKTYHYARSEMGRAILEAGQFSHVPEAQVWGALDGLEWPCCEEVTVRHEHGGVERVRGFFALATLDSFVEKFGALCPVCLRPVGFERRSPCWAIHEIMPTWLMYKGDCEYPPLAIREEPDWYVEAWQRRDWPGLGIKGAAHARCGLVANVAHWLSDGSWDEDSLGGVSYFFRRRIGGFHAYMEWLREQPPAPRLRFNPRIHRPQRPAYTDMRWKGDDQFERAA